ncbi:MAG TPA: hypothetical protein VEZ90_05305 [Blastocatellia bacterium]|nr:hypothetical protein [Blastocatellia bacterium]
MNENKKRQEEQKKAIDTLLSRFSYPDITEMLGVGESTVWCWRKGKRLARPEALRRLQQLAERVDGFAPATEPKTKTKSTQRSGSYDRGELLRKLGMGTARGRVRELKRMVKSAGISWVEFARILGIGVRTLATYRDPAWELPIRADVLVRIAEFKEALDNGRFESPEVRLRKAADIVIARRQGVPKTELAQEVGGRAGVSWRTVWRQMFQAEDKPKPNAKVLKVLEEMASKGSR